MAELQITLDIMLPVFILLALGWLLRRVGLMPGDVPGRLNKLIFSLFLPVMLFDSVRSLETNQAADWGFQLFCLLGISGIWLLAMLIVPRFEKDVRKRGVMVQGVFRSNFAILGVPLMDAMFGESGLAAVSLAMPAVVVVNNVLAVISLTSQSGQKADLKKIILSAVTNPLIIACALGGLFLLIDIRHDPSENDKIMYDWILNQGYEPVIIATKVDKLKRSQLKGAEDMVRNAFGAGEDTPVIPFSAMTKQGAHEICSVIRQSVLY